VMFLMPAVAMIATEDAGKAPPFIVKLQNQPAQWQMFTTTDTDGVMQRGGILLGIFGLALAELWFLASLGRIGTALDSPRLAGRTTRMTLLFGLFLVAAFLLAVGSFKPGSMGTDSPNIFADFSFQVSKYVEDQWRLYGQPQYDKLREHKSAVRPALGVLAGLIVGFGYFRMVGAGRTAVRNWLDTNDRP